jgi:hypothetical protein
MPVSIATSTAWTLTKTVVTPMRRASIGLSGRGMTIALAQWRLQSDRPLRMEGEKNRRIWWWRKGFVFFWYNFNRKTENWEKKHKKNTFLSVLTFWLWPDIFPSFKGVHEKVLKENCV